MWFFKVTQKEEKVTHEVIQVKHKKTPSGRCIVWVVCTCGESHAYAKIGPEDDDTGVNIMSPIVKH